VRNHLSLWIATPALVVAVASVPVVIADDENNVFDFYLTEDFVKDLVQKNTILYTMSGKPETRRSPIHLR